ncbi:antibiotic biosynthesis monooxygenase family protein [Aliiroseovarius sp.]|uniref:antibiotic biosynthesis monooxygenase family protein n=1 Tax=Aliiroseovarius sp. TaxID=1872442 RepID=UPI0026336347|nr:antibiotic biosynthesis monooxygenase family protein [Aliiroseovarius sp.]
MPVIKKDADLQTVITTYEVTPGTCADLCEEIRVACNEFISKQDGFIGAALHVNDAQTRIASYTQWRTRDDFMRVLRSEEMRVYHRKFNTLSKNFAPVLYDVVMVSDG